MADLLSEIFKIETVSVEKVRPHSAFIFQVVSPTVVEVV